MKKIIACLLMPVFLLSACSFNVQVLKPAESTPSASTPALPSPNAATSTPLPATPVPTPTPTGPRFFDARFAVDPADDLRQSLFPSGVQKIYALWNYEDMREGLVVKREWYLDGKLWLMREEPWDYSKYGANGTVRDVSIYELNTSLPSGVYHLKIFIDSVSQLIGPANGDHASTSAIFEIHSADEAIAGFISPDGQWSGALYGEKRIVLRDLDGTPTLLYTAVSQIPYLSWLPDSRHILFVDRDKSGQQPGTTVGARDNLWLVDIPSGDLHLLYKSNTIFNGRAGPVASTDGHFIAGIEGSGFADACMKDARVIFFELADDLHSAKSIRQEQFAGFPSSSDGSIFPAEDGEWVGANLFLITLDGTCGVKREQTGPYLFNASDLTVAKSSSSTAPLIAGDLGWGRIHGRITDTATGQPIAGAIVTCEHNSYTSPVRCSGSAVTNVDGIYIFSTVFFHDTDNIKLMVEIDGYQPQEFTQQGFTMSDMEKDFSLVRAP